jgi:hypothetical protein
MANMELITSVTVGSGGAASVTLPATGTIPTTYTDLKVIISARGDRAVVADNFYIRFNNDSGSNYVRKEIYGDGTNAASYGGTATAFEYVYFNGSTSTANTFNNFEMYIPNYASSNQKSFSIDNAREGNATSGDLQLEAGLWTGTAAINSIKFTNQSTGNFVEGSTFYLYGISNVTSGSKATGGIVSSDGTYWYHMFPFSGTFTPTSAISADVLVIAGGGSGGGSASSGNSGGGGAGGLVYSASQSLTATGYSVTVGAGGAATSSNQNNGSNSVFGGTITATGGGGGGQGAAGAGVAGGSAGGNAAFSTAGATASSPAGQGNAGGTAFNSPDYSSGGGGGAGAVGGNGTTTTGGAGGNGLNTYSSWAIATQTGADNGYYAGGGGGGTNGIPGAGGLGGGGRGAVNASAAPTSGLVNTGSGGGGAGNASTPTSGAGGSGIVIIRYAI